MSIRDEYEYGYETTIEQIVFQLEQLIADILLGSIKRLAGEYEDTVVKMSRAEMDEDKF